MLRVARLSPPHTVAVPWVVSCRVGSRMWDEGVEDAFDVTLPRDAVTPPRRKEKRKFEKSKTLASKIRNNTRDDDDGESDDDRGLQFSLHDDVDSSSDESSPRRKTKTKKQRTKQTQMIPIQVDFGKQIDAAENEDLAHEQESTTVPVSGTEMMAGFLGSTECACCAFELGETPDPDGNPMQALVHSYFLRHRATMSIGALSRSLVLFYEERVRARLQEDGIDMPPWTAAAVEQHLVGHIQDPLLKIDAQIRAIHVSLREISNNMYARKEDGHIKVDIDYTKLLIVCQKRETDLLRERAKLL